MNRIISCKATEEWLHTPYIETQGGTLRYAVVKATTAAAAKDMGRQIAAEVKAARREAAGLDSLLPGAIGLLSARP